jgi:hypothetical protein
MYLVLRCFFRGSHFKLLIEHSFHYSSLLFKMCKLILQYCTKLYCSKLLMNKSSELRISHWSRMRRSRMPKTNCSKFLAWNHFSLENGKLEFNLENEGLENRHYKKYILLGTGKDAILRIMTVLWRLLYLFIIFGTT